MLEGVVDNPKSRDDVRRNPKERGARSEERSVGRADYIAAGRACRRVEGGEWRVESCGCRRLFYFFGWKQALESNKEWKRKAKGVGWE
jgi:hypothetical protein